jgi:hypothetical protein
VVVVTRLQDGRGLRLPLLWWLPENAFVPLACLQSSSLLQSGLGIDPAIYRNFIGPDNDRVYDIEHFVVHFLGLHTGSIAMRRNSVQVNMFYAKRE